MIEQTRRTFLKRTGIGAAGAATLAVATARGAARANERFRLGVIGCGGRGTGVAQSFAELPDVEVVYACDPDARRAADAVKELSGKPKAVADMRRILDDPSIDAVLIATPDHWHAPAAILACEAGKHVYVEKPCSHNIREGRLLVEAARRNDRIVQHGTQSRTSGLVRKAIQSLNDGAIGRVLVAKAWNVQRRGTIGRAGPSEPPAGFDYDLWVGPAPMAPFQSNRHHYTWHWWYDFGTGDMGNDGVHELDIARWGLGVSAHPTHVAALGGKLAFDDDQQFPDTQQVVFQYPAENGADTRQLVYEQRLWSRYGLEGVDNGNAFYGTDGWMLVSKRGILKVFDERNRQRPIESDAPETAGHQADFVQAVRSGKAPAAEIEIGHLSATLCHLGNIATRLARSLRFDPAAERIVGDDEALALTGRKYRDHWATPSGV